MMMRMQQTRMAWELVLYCRLLFDQDKVLTIALIFSPQLSTLVICLVWSLLATMKSPGRTQWSCAVSKIRIRFSSLSNFMDPLLDDKALGLIDVHIV
jgi:hypothetical protein